MIQLNRDNEGLPTGISTGNATVDLVLNLLYLPIRILGTLLGELFNAITKR